MLLVGCLATNSMAEKSVVCGYTPTPCQSTPSQGLTLTNSQTTGAATTAVTVTLAALTGARAHVYSVEARCNTASATSDLTITDGGTTIFTSQAAQVTTVNNYAKTWPVPLTGATNSQVVITWAACTAGTGTLIVQTDRY
jgi:hypothetical protein